MTTKPATSTAKPAKNKLLSIYNRVMGLTLILVIAAAITFGVLANKYRTQARSNPTALRRLQKRQRAGPTVD